MEIMQPDWSKLAQDYDQLVSFTRMYALDCIEALQLPRVISKQSILDIAAGTGCLSFAIAETHEIGEDSKVIATDINPAMVEITKSKLANLAADKQSWLTCQVMDGQKLELPDESVSAIGCVFGVMFFNDRVKGFKEMLRVLQPGGNAAIAVWKTNNVPLMLEQVAIADGKLTIEQTPLPATKIPFCYEDESLALKELCAAGFRQADLQVKTVEHTCELPLEGVARALHVFPLPDGAKISLDAVRHHLRKLACPAVPNEPETVVVRGIAHIIVASKPVE